MDIKSLRALRTTELSKISSEFEKAANPESGAKSYKDDRFWKPERDKAGNASATIRFLPSTNKDDLPWVKIFSHGFQGPGGRWYIENSLTTLGQADPVSELNSTLWNSTTDDNSPARKQARAQKRKLNYIANVLIINDPKHPELNGTVKLFKFGKKIFDMIMDKARPTFEDEQPVNVFDYWDGANFKLRMKTVDRYPNYDSSAFEEVAPIGDDDYILEIAKQQHNLADFVAPSAFKSYNELKAKLESVLNNTAGPRATEVDTEDEPMPVAAPAKIPAKAAPKPKAKAPAFEDEDDDGLSYFQSIADED